MLAVCRTLFFILIIFTVTFLGANYHKLIISSDLKDLSPEITSNPLIQTAINGLSTDIESRLFLVLTADNADNIDQASLTLLSKINSTPNLNTNSISTNKLIETLKKYRFQLLSEQQLEQLNNKNIEKLNQQALTNLYRIDSALQLLPATTDPLSTFDNFIEALSKKISNNDNVTKKIELNNKNIYFQSFSLKINNGAMNIDQQRDIVNQINNLSLSLKQNHKVDLLRSGVVFFAADAALKSEQDIKFISALSTIAIITLLIFVFRSFLILILPVLSISIGILFALAVSHSIYGSIHILTIVFGASLIGIIIDYSLHYFYHMKDNKQHSSHHKKLLRAMLLSLITSLIGYSALGFSTLDALKKVAIFSCSGIFAAWLSVIVIGSLSRIRVATINDALFSYLLKQSRKLIAPIALRLSYFTWGLSLLVGLLFLYFNGPTINDDPRLFFKPSDTLIQEETFASQFSKNIEPGRYIILTGNTKQEIYNHYDTLSSSLANSGLLNPETAFFNAMQLLPSPEQQRINYRAQLKIYEPNGVASTLFTTLGLPDKHANDLYKDYNKSIDFIIDPTILFSSEMGLPPFWLSNQNKHLAFIMINKGIDANSLEEAIKNFNIPGLTFINTLDLAKISLGEQRSSATTLLFLAFVFISLILLIYYRKISALKLLLVPSSAIIGTLFLYKLFNLDITLFSVMALFLVLGLGMDYVIFIQEMASDTIQNTIDDDFAITQNAIFLSTITTLLSFGLLSLSTIPLAHTFGITLLFGNTLNFLASILYAQLNYSIQDKTKRSS